MVRTSEQLDYMLFPRLLAVAERAWHEADWQSAASGSLMRRRRTQDWEQFANTVGYRELRNLEHRGINYRLPPPGVRYLTCSCRPTRSSMPQAWQWRM